MSDRRLTPSNGRVAETGWEGRVEADRFVSGSWHTVTAPLTDLCRAPEGARERQLLLGDRFLVLESRDGWSFGRAAKDGYVGYVADADLGADLAATHVVAVRASHLYAAPDIKARDLAALSFGARFRIAHEDRVFFETTDGAFIPKPHLRPIDRPFRDPVTIAQLLFGTPYLWGGNSSFGIDCSGLVQVAHLACGSPCPGDSDMQMSLGAPVGAGVPARRGDLLFWEGHVAMAVDAETLIHANAHHMAVSYEPLEAAIARIAAQGGGPVTAHRRL
ncbi:NlpC/P60 family protein [Palleronia sp. KMU-117]|uniref:C40 family peptidase n=1 Tax=Palleronia sp. KMU-117 TaxID=3434108 RepID=UPI003D7321E1